MPPLLMEWCSGILVNYYYCSLWTNHSVCPLISGVYLQILVTFTHDTGNGEHQSSRTHGQGLWTVLMIKPQTQCKALSEDGCKRLRKVYKWVWPYLQKQGFESLSNPDSALAMGHITWWLLQKFQALAPPSTTLALTDKVLFAPNCSSLEICS